MYKSIFDFLFNIILLVVVHLFLNTILTRKYPLWVTLLLQLFQTVLAVTICNLLPLSLSAIKVMVIPVTTLVLVLLIYRERWWSCLLLTVCYVVLEYVMVLLFYPTEVVTAPAGTFTVLQELMAWLPLLAATIFALWLIYLGLRLLQDRLGLREVLMYAIFPISQFLLFYGWNGMVRTYGEHGSQVFMILIVIFAFVADGVLFSSVFQLSRQKELEAENRLLTRQIQAQKEHYSELTAQYDSIRRMRHDIAKHIYAVDSLLSAGRSEEAAVYVSELKAKPYDATLGICEHPVVDAYLHNAIQTAAAAGLTVEAMVTVPADVGLADTDLICTFGNLLDNAMEACEEQEGAVIRVESYVAGGCLVITAENPVFSEAQEKKPHIPGLERGVGMRVLADLAEKYGGRFSCEQDGGRFRSEIIYRLGER